MVLMFTSCTDHFLTADSCNEDSADFNLLIIPNWFINVWMMNIYISVAFNAATEKTF